MINGELEPDKICKFNDLIEIARININGAVDSINGALSDRISLDSLRSTVIKNSAACVSATEHFIFIAR